MSKVLFDVLSDKGGVSSARLINVVGAITGTAVVLYNALYLNDISSELFGIYMVYCGGVYGVGKYIDRRNDASSNNEYSEGYKTADNNGTAGRIDNPDA